jgi:hypothetical protein
MQVSIAKAYMKSLLRFHSTSPKDNPPAHLTSTSFQNLLPHLTSPEQKLNTPNLLTSTLKRCQQVNSMQIMSVFFYVLGEEGFVYVQNIWEFEALVARLLRQK